MLSKWGNKAFEERQTMYKLSKTEENKDDVVYKSVMSNVIYNSIPAGQISKVDVDDGAIKDHIGEVVATILPFQEFNDASKDSNDIHVVYIRGYINGGRNYYSRMISEATSDEEVEKAPKKTEDVLGDVDYGDISQRISSKIEEEIQKDNEKIEKEREEEKEMVEKLEDEEEDDFMDDFSDEVGEDDEVDMDDIDGGPDADDDEESDDVSEEDTDDEDLDEDIEEPEEEDDDSDEEEEQIQESSTFHKIASADPFGDHVNKDKDCIRIIKNKVVNNYAKEEMDAPDQAKVDAIVYVSAAITLHELGIMRKKEFLERME